MQQKTPLFSSALRATITLGHVLSSKVISEIRTGKRNNPSLLLLHSVLYTTWDENPSVTFQKFC